MKTVTGKWKMDQNFIRIYSDNTIYEIARNTKEWACISVGSMTAMGHILTQEDYDKWASECKKEGTFYLQ